MDDSVFRLVTSNDRPVREVWPYGKIKGYYATESGARKALRHCPQGSRIQVTGADWTDLEP